jgi:hypothetical protein
MTSLAGKRVLITGGRAASGARSPSEWLPTARAC